MERPWSVKSEFGNRPTSISVWPLLTARLMIAAARLRRSSSETPDGPFNLSSNAFFSASMAACLRTYSEAFAASASAIFLLQSVALGRMSSTFTLMAYSPDTGAVFHPAACTEPIEFTKGPKSSLQYPHLTSLVGNRARIVFDLSQGGPLIHEPESYCI